MISKNVQQKICRYLTSMAAFLVVASTPTLLFAAEIESYINVDSFESLLVAILRIFITIATPIIVFFIIYAGFLYVTARGNVEQTQQATRALTYAVIGAILIIGSVAIAEIIERTIDPLLAN